MDIRNEIVDTIMLKMQNVIDELAMERLQAILLENLEKDVIEHINAIKSYIQSTFLKD